MENENINGISLPTNIRFGNKELSVPDDISSKDVAKLSIVLSFAASGVLVGASQETVDLWLEEMGVSKLFINNR